MLALTFEGPAHSATAGAGGVSREAREACVSAADVTGRSVEHGCWKLLAAGGEEASLFAEDCVRYSTATHQEWRIEAVMEKRGHGIRRVRTNYSSQDAIYSHLKHEIGVHKVQRVP